MTLDDRTGLVVTGLVKRFPVDHRGRRAQLTAVDHVDLTIRPGETVAVVGESGSGKSTLARCVARLVEPTAGSVSMNGLDLTGLPRRSLWRAYSDLQMVFQDPLASLNPRMTACATVEEPLALHARLPRAQRLAEVRRLFEEVRLDPSLMGRYPRQLSGGQRQRVSIARALAVSPRFVLLDEPTAALDVSVRGSVLALLTRLQRERELGYLLISHDLSSVRRLADRVVVMYLGSVVEQGTTEEIFDAPRHPYTRALLSAALPADRRRVGRRIRLGGEIPSPVDIPDGCRLAGRCPIAEPACSHAPPPLLPVTTTHRLACPVVDSRHDRREDPLRAS